MFGPRVCSAPCLGLSLLLLAACGPDRTLPLESTAPRQSLDVAASLASAEPSGALYSERVAVTLRGTGLLSPVLAVTIDTVVATEVTRVDANTMVAVFEGGSPARVGLHTVSVHLADGVRAELPNGFRWRFDQDPVVFVHGCPLPKDDRFDVRLGSVTNYVTSKYWHALYTDLRAEGYPAPRWDAQEDFVQPPFRHKATRPAPNNYLNLFILPEDSRDTAHVELAPPVGTAGHCGSGLLLARELNHYVNEVLEKTGAPKVDLVVNSGSALGARWFLHPDGYDGAPRVRDVVFLAAMNHGTEVAIATVANDDRANWWSPNYEMAREGFPAYACKGLGRGGLARNAAQVGGRDGRDLQYLVNGCFADPSRQARDEIPGDHRKTPWRAEGTAYLSIYNAVVDELIEPTTAACLHQRFPGDCGDTDINVPVHATAPGETPHGAIRADPEVRALTVCHLQRRSHARPAPSGECERERALATIVPTEP